MANAVYIEAFDRWSEGLAGATVTVYAGDTTNLASLYYDAAATVPCPNPVTLDTLEDDCGCRFGRWAQPVYVAGSSYSFVTSTGTASGLIQVPFVTLDGADASGATVTVDGSTTPLELRYIAAWEVRVESYGTLGGSAASNSALIVTALSVAAAQGGGRAILPAGSWLWNGATIPSGVALVGQGAGATILRSQIASATVTLGGQGASLEGLTLDGVARIAGSVGVKGWGVDFVRIERVAVQNFEMGGDVQGGHGHRYVDLVATANGTNWRWLGDSAQTSNGVCADHRWVGGQVTASTTFGLLCKQGLRACRDLAVEQVEFSSNLGPALQVEGASFATFGEGCRWTGNVTDIVVKDNTATATAQQTQAVEFVQCRLAASSLSFAGLCKDVRLLRCVFEQPCTIALSSPLNSVLLEQCREEGLLTLTGDTLRLVRKQWRLEGTSKVITTDATVTTAWAFRLAPGVKGLLRASIVAVHRSGATKWGGCELVAHVDRPGWQLDYRAQTVSFSTTARITGATSGFTGIIAGDTNSGHFGTLELHEVIGVPIDGETITDSLGGRAVADGSLYELSPNINKQVKPTSPDNSTTTTGSPTQIDSHSGSDAILTSGCAFDTTATEAVVTVTGIAAQTFYWYVTVTGVLSD